MVGQRARESVLYLNSDLWYNWPRFDRDSEVMGAHVKAQRTLGGTGFGSRLPERFLLDMALVSQAGNLRELNLPLRVLGSWCEAMEETVLQGILVTGAERSL